METYRNGNRVMIELRKQEIVYDIKNTAYIFADSQTRQDTEPHSLHNVFDVAEAGNMDRLARILDSAVEDCREMLYRFCKVDMRGGGFDTNEWEECAGSPTNNEEAYYLVMVVPENFSASSVHTMTVYIHDFLVYQSLYEWMSLVYPDGAEQFKLLAEEKKQKYKDASIRTMGHARIRLHPF